MRISVDVGGTFTDVILYDETKGNYYNTKVMSDPEYPDKSVLEGLTQISQISGLKINDSQDLIHGTTIVTNSLLERKIASVGVLITKGFRDLLEIGRQQRSNLYDLIFSRSAPLAPRHLISEVEERINSAGEILIPLDTVSAEKLMHKLILSGIESLAIVLLFSFKNSIHERQLKDIALKYISPNFVFISSEISPEFREYERASTTLVAAAVAPKIVNYIKKLEKELKSIFETNLNFLIMHSGGGTLLPREAKKYPHKLIESGPAAGIIAACQLSKILDLNRTISFDMGGTSAKMGLVLNGAPHYTSSFEVGGDLHHSQRLSGTGYPIRFSMIDVAEVGAGAGSIAWIDPGGLLKVGPISAGAKPGPACYGKGGEKPTVTDAHLILGHLDPEQFLGGKMPLFPNIAEKALQTLSRTLNLSIEEVSQGILDITNANMLRTLKLVTIDRGYDPRKLTLMAFGGAGPLHACDLAEKISMPRIIIPKLPGVFSALGLLHADMSNDFVETVMISLETSKKELIGQKLAELKYKADQFFENHEVPIKRRSIKLSADLRYQHQNHELNIHIEKISLTNNSLKDLKERFNRIHELNYGHYLKEEPIQIVNLRLLASEVLTKPKFDRIKSAEKSLKVLKDGLRLIKTPDHPKEYTLYQREKLQAANIIYGPAIIQEMQTSTLLKEGWKLKVDSYGNLIINVDK